MTNLLVKTKVDENPTRARRSIFKSLESKSLKSRPLATRLADKITSLCSNPFFMFLNMVWFVVWIVLNSGFVHGFTPFDPYPFGFLTVSVSLEAIFLSILVLISQNRAAQIATLREELNLRVNLISEQEITKLLKMQAHLHRRLRLKGDVDPELELMIQDIDATSLEQSIVEQVARADEPIFKSLTKKEFPELLQALTGGKRKSTMAKHSSTTMEKSTRR
jgi:uncharacterized membrane protein